jgi:O-acetyl-ADP-ribose deacetylase (regulator of RNase III)
MPPTLEYPTPADYPPFTPLMPPLLTHSPTGWLRGAYARAADWQKAHFRIKLPNGQYKDVFVIIPRANDLLAGPGNSDGTHKDWDLITEAANPDLGDGGGTAGITYGHYGENGWTETPTFKKFRAYQQTRRRYFQEHAADFETRGFTIPAHFRTLQIDCGEVLTNEGADHGKDNGFQALAHVLGPNSEANMHKLKIGYATLAKEAVRINAYSIYITGVSEAIYARDPVQCAGIAVPEFLDAYMAALQNAKPGTVDSSPVYCVFGRYANDRSYADPDDPETWTAGDAAYRDNLRIWRDTHPEFALP